MDSVARARAGAHGVRAGPAAARGARLHAHGSTRPRRSAPGSSRSRCPGSMRTTWPRCSTASRSRSVPATTAPSHCTSGSALPAHRARLVQRLQRPRPPRPSRGRAARRRPDLRRCGGSHALGTIADRERAGSTAARERGPGAGLGRRPVLATGPGTLLDSHGRPVPRGDPRALPAAPQLRDAGEARRRRGGLTTRCAATASRCPALLGRRARRRTSPSRGAAARSARPPPRC